MPAAKFRGRQASRKFARERFVRARKAEQAFARQLSKLAQHVGHLVDGFAPGGVVEDMPGLQAALDAYAALVRPWARKVAARMVAEVDQRDAAAWKQLGQEMGRLLRAEVRGADTGRAARHMLEEQVELITSLPLGAAKRVHRLTQEGLADSTRAKEIAREIAKTGSVTESRAMLIARTEVSRTAASLTMARAQHVGSEGYVWRTAGDSDVRKLHKHLEGKFFRWDDPPVSGESGERAHAGCIYNCRCWMEPVLPDVIA